MDAQAPAATCSPACTKDAPRCTEQLTCGPCVTSAADCIAFADSTPVCASNGACVTCTSEDESLCTAQGTHCKVDPNPALSICVACTDNSHCSAATPICGADNTCHPCQASDPCGAGKFCETASGSFQGQCVECSKDEVSNCLANGQQYVCNGSTRTCDLSRPAHSQTLCDACDGTGACGEHFDCVSDLECQSGQLCVNVPAGGGKNLCLRLFVEPECPRPFSREVSLTSVDGKTATVCSFELPESTCQAHRDYNKKRCGRQPLLGKPEQDVQAALGDDSVCGEEGLEDAACLWNASRSQYLCTVACDGVVPLPSKDCPNLAAVVCESTHFCSF